METANTHSKEVQAKKKEELYFECQHWKSILGFMDDEIAFIHRLLNSYVFEPNTPNLFERLQDYLDRLKKIERYKAKVSKLITAHENSLGGILECTDDGCDLGFYQTHDTIKAEVVACNQDFQHLKSEIFNYAGGILKKRKP